MISIRDSLAELERAHRLRQITLDCYVTAVRDAARYAIDLEEGITAPYRRDLEALARSAAGGELAPLQASQGALRELLRDYRNKAGKYIANIKEELSSSVRALEEIVESLAQGEGENEARLRGGLNRLRDVASSTESALIRTVILETADGVEQTVEDMRKQHRLTISQFQVEIRMLHNRIDALERAALAESMSSLLTREEFAACIRAAGPENYSLLLLRAAGVDAATRTFGDATSLELAASVAKRLRSSLPPDAVLARWDSELFVAKLTLTRPEAMALAKRIAETLSGFYVCAGENGNVRSAVQATVAVVDRRLEDEPDRTLERIGDFFGPVAPRFETAALSPARA